MMPIRDIAKEFIVLVGFAVITAMTFNYFSPQGISLLGDWDQSECVDRADTAKNVNPFEFEIKDVYRAKEIFDSGQAVFVDARAEEFYANGHIKGAISLPLDQINDRMQSFKKEYPASVSVITYCYGKVCNDSHKLARYFIEIGYTNVSVFTEGFVGWQEEGYPVE